MVVAHVVHGGCPDDLIGAQEFASLPPIGAIISVLDRNSNRHRLKVTSLEFFGISPDPERKPMQLALSGQIRIRIIGSTMHD